MKSECQKKKDWKEIERICESNWLGQKAKLRCKEKLMKKILMKTWSENVKKRDWKCAKVID